MTAILKGVTKIRIERIALKNYRQYQDQVIEFPKHTDKDDLHLVIGENGSGKTNILNAINWCLYGDEPHLSGKYDQLPMLNKNVRDQLSPSQTESVVVEIKARADNGQPITFTRNLSFTRPSNGGQIRSFKEQFFVVTKDSNNNDNIHEDPDETKNFVRRFVPQDLRDYYFFDGERLDNYFKDFNGTRIQKEIMDISKIGVLKRVDSHLDTVSREYMREVTRNSPDLEIVRGRVTELERNKGESEARKNEVDNQIGSTRARIKQISDSLTDIPDVEGLEKDRARLKEQAKKKEERINSKKAEKNSLLYEFCIPLLIFDPLVKSKEFIKERRDNEELPPTNDLDIINTCLAENKCKICGRDLDSAAKKYLDEIKERFAFSTKIGAELISMETPIAQRIRKAQQYRDRLERINEEIKDEEEELAQQNEQIVELDNKYQSFGKDEIRNLQSERNKLDGQLEKLIRESENLNTGIQRVTKDLENAKRDFNSQITKQKREDENLRKANYCNSAREIITGTIDDLLEEIRKRIENETTKNFFEMLWKESSYKKAIVKSDYSVILYDEANYAATGSASAAEMELLVMAFTLALHHVSGFDAPIIVDTPVGRVSGKNRENFGEIAVRVSEKKQTILLLSGDEFSPNLQRIIAPAASNIYRLKMMPDERSTEVVGM